MIRKLFAAAAILIVVASAAVVLFVRGMIGGDAVRRTLEAQLSARAGQPVRIASLGASFFPRVSLDLHDVAIGQPVRGTIAQLSIATGLRGLLSRRVEDAEVIVSNGRLPVELALAIAAAPAAAGPSTASNELTIVSVRTLSFRHVELVAEPHSLVVDLESSIAGDRLEVRRLVAESVGTRLEAHGALTSIARRQGTFTASAGQLKLDELLAVASGLTGGGSSGPAAASPLDITVELTAPGGDLGGYSFQALSSTVRIGPEELVLDSLRFGIFGGQYDGQLRVTPSSPPRMSVAGKLGGMDVETILRQTRGTSAMSGKMGGTLRIASRGASSSDILRGAHGSARVAIADGAIPGLEMVRAVVLAFGKPSGAPPEGSGSRFTRLEGTFTLADQTLRSQDVSFASRDFDMTGTVVLRLPSGAIDMRANVVLSRELTAQAGTDLRRYAQEDGRVILPATIRGTLAQPTVSLDVAAAVNRALQNEIKRKVKGWLDRLIK